MHQVDQLLDALERPGMGLLEPSVEKYLLLTSTLNRLVKTDIIANKAPMGVVNKEARTEERARRAFSTMRCDNQVQAPISTPPS